MNGAIKILKISQEQDLTAPGPPRFYIRVDFNVGDHGPFTERFPKETFDTNSANAALLAFAQKVAALSV